MKIAQRLFMVIIFSFGLLATTAVYASSPQKISNDPPLDGRAAVCVTPITVMNNNSSGADSLRQAIADVCDGGLITFDASLSGDTIDISTGSPITGQLTISKSVTISGSVPITVSGGNAVRVFNVMTGTTPTVDVVFDSLTIANGNAQILTDCELTGYLYLCDG